MDAEKQTVYLLHPASGTPVYAIAENVREASFFDSLGFESLLRLCVSSCLAEETGVL